MKEINWFILTGGRQTPLVGCFTSHLALNTTCDVRVVLVRVDDDRAQRFLMLDREAHASSEIFWLTIDHTSQGSREQSTIPLQMTSS
jgi:hypothetical protein